MKRILIVSGLATLAAPAAMATRPTPNAVVAQDAAKKPIVKRGRGGAKRADQQDAMKRVLFGAAGVKGGAQKQRAERWKIMQDVAKKKKPGAPTGPRDTQTKIYEIAHD